MKRWYNFYNEPLIIGQQAADLIPNEKGQRTVDQFGKGQQVANLLEMPDVFGRVPWYHHVEIIEHCNSLDEALFYVNKVAKEGWSRSMLENQLETHLFQREGAIPSNFDSSLPAEQSQGAQQIFKDPYHFEFLSLQENYTEHELEEALVHNITHFLLELGKGFAYVGRQMELRMEDGTAFFPDLVFYHIPQKRYVVIELKAVEFMPEFAGKLNFYVTAADELLRGEGDNPSVGIIICKTAKKTVVEWSLKDIQKPLGVATYQLEQIVERTVLELKQREKKK